MADDSTTIELTRSELASIACLIRVLAPRITAAPHATVSSVVNMRRMRILVTGASGVLGRVIVPLLDERGNQLAMPSSFQQGSSLTLEQQPARMRG
jgi:hypothetical protein